MGEGSLGPNPQDIQQTTESIRITELPIQRHRQILQALREKINQLFVYDPSKLTANQRFTQDREQSIARRRAAGDITEQDAFAEERELTDRLIQTVERSAARMAPRVQAMNNPQLAHDLQLLDGAMWHLHQYAIRPQDWFLSHSVYASHLDRYTQQLDQLSPQFIELLATYDVGYVLPVSETKRDNTSDSRTALTASESVTEPATTQDEAESEVAAAPTEQVEEQQPLERDIPQVQLSSEADRKENMLEAFAGGEEEPTYVGRIETENHAVYERMFMINHFNFDARGRWITLTGDYRPVAVPLLATLPPRQPIEADITLPLNQKTGEAAVPLAIPAGFTIVGINQPAQLERSQLGLWRCRNLAPVVHEITYRITPSNEVLQLDKAYLDQWLTPVPVAEVKPQTRTADRMVGDAQKLDEKVRIITGGIRSLDPIYTLRPELGALYKAANDRLFLAFEALDAIGLCGTLAAHTANRFRQHQIPACIVNGITPIRDAGQFNGNAGHAQVVYLDEEFKPSIFEATSVTDSQRAITPELLAQAGYRELLAQIPSLDDQQLFEALSKFAKAVKPALANPVAVAKERQNIPDWVQSAEVKSLEQDDEAGDFFKTITFFEKWLQLDPEQLGVEEIKELIEEYCQFSITGAQLYVNKQMVGRSKAELNAAKKKYSYLYTIPRPKRTLEQCLKRKLAALPDPQKYELSHWIVEKFDLRNGVGNRKDAFFDTFELFDLLDIDFLTSLSLNDKQQLCAIFLKLSHISQEKVDPRTWQIHQENCHKAILLSQELRDQTAKKPHSLWLDLFGRQSFGTTDGPAITLLRALETEKAVDTKLPEATILANLVEASEQTDEFFEGLLHRAAFARSDEFVAIQRLFQLLGQIDNHYLSPDGLAAANLQTLAINELPQRCLPGVLNREPLTGTGLAHLRTLGIDIARVFSTPELMSWLEGRAEIEQAEINFCLTAQGSFDPAYPVSALIYQGGSSDYQCRGLPQLRSLFSLCQALPIEEVMSQAKQRWPTRDEKKLAESLFYDKVWVVWSPYNEGLEIQDIVHSGKWNEDGFSTHFELPNDLYDEEIKRSPYLAAAVSDVNGSRSLAEPWESIYEDPELGQLFREQLNGEVYNVSQEVRRQLSQRYFNATERYQIALFLSAFLRGPAEAKQDLEAQIDQLIELANRCLTVPAADLTAQNQEASDRFRDLVITSTQDLEHARLLDFAIAKIEAPVLRRALCIIGSALADLRSLNATSGWNISEHNLDSALYSCFLVPSQDDRLLDGHHKSPFVDDQAAPLAGQYGRNLQSFTSRLTIEDDQLDAIIPRIARQTTKRSYNAFRPETNANYTNFAQYLSDMLGKETKVKSTGGILLESREYRPGDDFRSIDWNTTARSEKIHVKEVNEQRTNPLYCVVDAEWLAERVSPTGEELPPHAEELIRLIFLARNERVPIHLSCYFRGERLRSFSARELRDMTDPQKQIEGREVVLYLWRLAFATHALADQEKRRGIDLPGTRIMRLPVAPPKPSTIAPFIASRNRTASAALIARLQSPRR